MKNVSIGLTISVALLFGYTAQAEKLRAYNKSNGKQVYHACFTGMRAGIKAYRNTEDIEFAVDEFIGAMFRDAKYVKIGLIFAYDYKSFKEIQNNDFDNGYTYRSWLKAILKQQIDNVGDPFLDFRFKRRMIAQASTIKKQCEHSFGQFNPK